MRALALIAACLALPAPAQELALPTGATLTHETASEAGSYALPTGPFAQGAVPVEVIEGAVLRQSWRVPGNGRTTLQLLAPLRSQITGAGFEVLLDCRTRQCGGFDFRFGTEVLPGPGMYVDLTDFRFLAARDSEGGAISVLVSRSAAAGFVQIIRVGVAARVAPGAAPDPVSPGLPQAVGPLADELERRGRVVLDDLSFETGAAALGAGRFDSLAALARYLAGFPDRRVALVGPYRYGGRAGEQHRAVAAAGDLGARPAGGRIWRAPRPARSRRHGLSGAADQQPDTRGARGQPPGRGGAGRRAVTPGDTAARGAKSAARTRTAGPVLRGQG